MLRLSAPITTWIEAAPGVEIEFSNISSRAWRLARRAAADAGDLTETAVSDDAGEAFSRSLIKSGICGWRGVGDADGNIIDPTAEYVDLLLADPVIFERLDRLYVMPFALRIFEGNALAASPAGTSTKAMAAPDIANSHAVASTADVQNVPMSSKSRAPKRAKRSGK